MIGLIEENWEKETWRLIYGVRKIRKAIEYLDEVLERNPRNDTALAIKANALNELANKEKNWQLSLQAVECADEALKINPNNDTALFNKSWALIDLGKPREALQHAEKALRINPINEYAWYNKAWANYLLGKREKAIECCNKALKISPRNRIIEHGKEIFLKNEMPEHLQKFKK